MKRTGGTGSAEQRQAREILSALAERLKILYFIPHASQDLGDASPLGMYTPGILASAHIILSLTEFPADVREPFSDQVSILRMRLLRHIWRHVIPIDIRTLTEEAKSGVGSYFCVVLTNDEDVASAVDKLQFSDKVPFLHVSSVAGRGRLSENDFDLDHLIEYVDSVLSYLSKDPQLHLFISTTKELMKPVDREPPKPLKLVKSFHNVTTPNECALMSYRWQLVGEDEPIKPNMAAGVHGDHQQYIDRICLTADTVLLKRQELMENTSPALIDSTYLISVPSVYWGYYQDWRDVGKGLTGVDLKAFNVALKSTIQQSTYFDRVEVEDHSQLMENKYFQSFMHSRAMDQRCYTAGLALLASATLTPVLRLEPKLNKVRGDFKVLAQCVRSGARIRSQFKQSRLVRAVGLRMRDLIDDEFLTRIDHCTAEPTIQGLKVASDIPLEWLPCGGMPLGLRYDLSRIPVLPGNLFLFHCVRPPIHIRMEELFDILIIRSFDSDDQLKSMLEGAISTALKQSEGRQLKICTVDVGSEDELVSALETQSGAILIFDGHGSYESQLGVGTFVVGGKPIEIWGLKRKCEFPPIVLFSACDTHPLDGGHGSCANAAFTLGAMTVLATSLPVDGLLAAAFIGRLMLRIVEFVPIALKYKKRLTWREVVSGMLRMTYVTEVTRLLIKHKQVSIGKDAISRVQLAANTKINNGSGDWYDVYLESLSKESGIQVDDLRSLVTRWASLTDALKYIQLGSPENIIITSDAPRV